MAKTSVATTEIVDSTEPTQELIPAQGAQLPALRAQALLEEDAGHEHYDLKDIAVPFVSILQALSPQVNKRDEAYIEGADAGMFFNSATNKVYDGERGILVVTVTHQRRYAEWWPRDSKAGKGLVADYGDDEQAAMRRVLDRSKYPWATAEGTVIIEAGTFYALILESPSSPPVRAVFSMSGTQFKKYKRLNSIIQSFQIPRLDENGQVRGYFSPPSFARCYLFQSVPEKNDQGNWMGYKITPSFPLIPTNSPADDMGIMPGGQDVYMLARSFRKEVDAGTVVVQQPDQATTVEEEAPF